MNALQIAVLAGGSLALGLLLIGLWLVPAHPALASIAALVPVRRVAAPPPEDLYDRAGAWLTRRYRSPLPEADLAVSGKSAERYLGERLVLAAVFALAGPLVSLALAQVGVALAIPLAASVALVGLGWWLPSSLLRTQAAARRLEFVQALSAYVSLVAIERSAGVGSVRQALEEAAGIAPCWPFLEIRESLELSARQRVAAWDGLEELSAHLAIPELEEVAGVLRLAGHEDAQVAQNLRALSQSVRVKLLLAEQARANAVSQRMGLPLIAMALCIIAVLITPTILRLLTLM
ncbi:MAG: hypothetical protein LBR21_06395 [Propionibacteriaceae bacterium]|jgi:Flp pilus assembly protein TadB|nr:hypothetical protein [Propionibacteriaceae bacterium]